MCPKDTWLALSENCDTLGTKIMGECYCTISQSKIEEQTLCRKKHLPIRWCLTATCSFLLTSSCHLEMSGFRVTLLSLCWRPELCFLTEETLLFLPPGPFLSSARVRSRNRRRHPPPVPGSHLASLILIVTHTSNFRRKSGSCLVSGPVCFLGGPIMRKNTFGKL